MLNLCNAVSEMNNKCDQNIILNEFTTLHWMLLVTQAQLTLIVVTIYIGQTLSGHLQIGFVFISSTAKNQSICSAKHKSQGVYEILISN